MRSYRTRREGFALAIAIFAIVVIGALIAGVFFAATQQYRIGRNEILLERAMGAAEYGQNVASTQGTGGLWNSAWASWAPGHVDSITVTSPLQTGTSAVVHVARIGDANNAVYLLNSEGRTGSIAGAQARRRTSMLIKLQPFQLNVLAALTTRGSAKIGGSSLINGIDTPYPGWNCPPTLSNKPGLALPDTTQIQYSGCKNLSCLNGAPLLSQNPLAADTNTYFNYGSGLAWNSLVAMAKTVTGGPGTPTVVNGQCNTGDPNNWGDPNRATPAGPCESYFPVLYFASSAHLTGGAGQGILLVNGNLQVDGGFQFYGPVIVRGDLSTAGTGGHFNGGVMAANVNLAQNTVLGNAVITYSSCIMNRVLMSHAIPQPLGTRPWAELF